jgi:hydroxycarboxylate dehydrogenase B
MPRVQVEPLKRLLRAVFEGAGCPPDEAGRVAHYLTRASLTGHDSHGVIRTQRYVEWLREGWVKAGEHAEPVLDQGPLAILDGRHGMGQTVGPESVAVGVAKAREHGVAVVALRSAGHLGRIGDFAELAAAEGLVSLHFVNVYGSLLVAPFGGRDRRFSTNPVAIGVPTGDPEAPFILDFATALVAEGKVLVAHQGGPAVPVGALVSETGELTNDPRVLYGPDEPGHYPDPRRGTGAMRAFGDHKGSGLALACDLLAGALAGSGHSRVSEGRVHNGMLSVYLDPARFGDADRVRRDVDDYIAWVKSCAPADPAAPVIVPGDKERRLAAERTAQGLPLPDEVWRSILSAAALAGLDQARIDAALADAAA